MVFELFTLFFLYQDPLVLWTHAQTLENGLSQSTISCMVQDSRGFVWLGTQDGLNRFDGYQYKVYRPEQGNSESIGSPGVQALLAARDGSLWIGTYQGLNHYLPHRDAFVRYQHEQAKESLVHDDIRCLAEDEFGCIWIGTRGGLSCLDPKSGKWQTFWPSQSGASDSVLAMVIRNGKVWLGTDSGYACWDSKQGQWQVANPVWSEIAIQSLLVLAEEKIVLGCQDGLRVMDMQGNPVDHVLGFPLQQAVENPVNALLHDGENLWIATEGSGLVVLNSDQGFRQVVDPPDSQFAISDMRISALMQDSSGLIWIGTYWRGLRIYNPFSLYFSIRRNEEVPGSEPGNRIIRCFLEGPDEGLWIGSEGSGLTHQVSPGVGTVYRHDPQDVHSLPDNRVFCLFSDAQQTMWVGMEAGHFSRFDAQSFSFENFVWSSGGDRPGPVRAIQASPDGMIWLGNDGGCLAQKEKKTGNMRYFRAESGKGNALAYDRIFCLWVDDRNQLWIGTFGGGLDR
ncbi:MAG: hypothetical protein KDC71_21100, partial [Acidobacteria bacterium]|nr:hypothetical protein [Acidobacteriota bacterium]